VLDFGSELLFVGDAGTTEGSRPSRRVGVEWVNQYKPFVTLGFAVTGKMTGGTVVNKQTISREDALVAHTRNNAYFVFQEDNLGSIAPGKWADLVVLDKDYLTIPADEIKDIQPTMTMVGGKIAWDGAAR
jgi:predicted amidohydrolase YtcJ